MTIEPLRSHAAELVALTPDVIVTIGSLTVTPLQQATSTIPIVFHESRRSGGRRLRAKPGTAGRQHHWVH